MKSIGVGVKEIRVRGSTGAFRVIYVAKFEEAVYVLHCFQKKAEKTEKAALDLARARLKELMRGGQMSKRKFDSVWEAIEDTPREAASLKARSELMMALQEQLKGSGMTQTQAAKILGVTQPRISDPMRGRIELFSLESLVDMITSAGLKVEFRLRKVRKVA